MSRETDAPTAVSRQTGEAPRVGHRAWLPVALVMAVVAWVVVRNPALP